MSKKYSLRTASKRGGRAEAEGRGGEEAATAAGD
jgi:hypothetical protein